MGLPSPLLFTASHSPGASSSGFVLPSCFHEALRESTCCVPDVPLELCTNHLSLHQEAEEGVLCPRGMPRAIEPEIIFVGSENTLTSLSWNCVESEAVPWIKQKTRERKNIPFGDSLENWDSQIKALEALLVLKLRRWAERASRRLDANPGKD